MAEIKQLWVDKAHRGLGIGRQLLEAAIAEAIERRCQCDWVMSYGFQAPGLYEKCGFERVAELKDWPPGHSNFVLRRRLQKGARSWPSVARVSLLTFRRLAGRRGMPPTP